MQSFRLSSFAIFAALLVFVLSGIAQNVGWSRVVLTGTGLSIESPVPLRLDQDKPDGFNEYQKAYVRWSLRSEGVFGTFVYEEKAKDQRTPRQEAEYYATLFAGSATPALSRITDITYLGQSAAKLEQQVLDPYEKKEMYRTFVVFGQRGKLANVNLVYPVGDANAKRIAERVFASVQLAGSVAATSSLEPPSNWKTVQFAGLSYQTPNPLPDTTCRKIDTSITGYVTANSTCHKWGDAFSILIKHERFNRQAATPEPTKQAYESVAGYKELDGESTLRAGREYEVKPFQIAGAEAAKLEHFMSVGTAASRTDAIFIRKGAEFWTVTVIYPLRYDFSKAAAERIIRSIALAAASSDKPPVPANTTAFASGFELAKKGQYNEAIKQYTAALSSDPKNGNIYLHRGLSKYLLGDYDGSISDYSTAIIFGATSYQSYFNRGTAYYAKNDYAAAIRDLTTSINSKPDHLSSYYNRGLAYSKSGQPDKAITDFSSAIKLDAKHVNSYLMRAQMLCDKKLIISAIKDEDKAISLGGKPTKRCGRN